MFNTICKWTNEELVKKGKNRIIIEKFVFRFVLFLFVFRLLALFSFDCWQVKEKNNNKYGVLHTKILPITIGRYASYNRISVKRVKEVLFSQGTSLIRDFTRSSVHFTLRPELLRLLGWSPFPHIRLKVWKEKSCFLLARVKAPLGRMFSLDKEISSWKISCRFSWGTSILLRISWNLWDLHLFHEMQICLIHIVSKISLYLLFLKSICL